jgi:hypothetical protein
MRRVFLAKAGEASHKEVVSLLNARGVVSGLALPNVRHDVAGTMTDKV